MQRFQIEVHARASRHTPDTWFYVDAATEQAAIDEGKRAFGRCHPGKDYTFKAVIPPLCPKCGGELRRVRQRLVDRLFSPGRHRYQCNWPECDWAGNVSIKGTGSIRFFLVRGFTAASIAVVVTSVAFLMFSIHRDRLAAKTGPAKRAKAPPAVKTLEPPPAQRPANGERNEAPGGKQTDIQRATVARQ